MLQATLSLCRLPATWIDARAIDDVVASIVPFDRLRDLEIQVPVGGKLLLDGVIRLLAFANQLSARGISVRLSFEEGQGGAMGYLDRIGFFEQLSPDVSVAPPPPRLSGFHIHRGSNTGLIELEPIQRDRDDDDLPDRLAQRLVDACAARADASLLFDPMWTIFAELISNFKEHSASEMDAVVGLQAYRNGNNVRVVVSDNGRGLMHTLRPQLALRDPGRWSMNDADLLVTMFTEGVSRFPDKNRGAGLKACADKALKFGAQLDVRLETQHVRLRPSPNGYNLSNTISHSRLAPLRGTHIALSFRLV